MPPPSDDPALRQLIENVVIPALMERLLRGKDASDVKPS